MSGSSSPTFNTQPMVLCGGLYAIAALLGSLSYASMRYLVVPGNRRRTGGKPGGILPVGFGHYQ